MSYIDYMSSRDYRSTKMDKNQALKKIRLIFSQEVPNIIISGHAERAAADDNLSTMDIINILKSPNSKITDEPELKNGTFRYRVKTNNYVVVVVFTYAADGLMVVTVWEIKKI